MHNFLCFNHYSLIINIRIRGTRVDLAQGDGFALVLHGGIRERD